MKFPARQSDIAQMAEMMVKGYFEHTIDFPSVNKMTLKFQLSKYKNYVESQLERRAALSIATKNKNEKLTVLTNLMKNCIKKSIVDTGGNPAKMALIGWGLSHKGLVRNAAPKDLRISEKYGGNIQLKWQKCSIKNFNHYVIERRQKHPQDIFSQWRISATSLTELVSLENQPRGIELEYRIIAVGSKEKSMPSNTVTMIL